LEGEGRDPNIVFVEDFETAILLYNLHGELHYAFYELSVHCQLCFQFTKKLDLPPGVDVSSYLVTSRSISKPYQVFISDSHGHNFIFQFDKRGLHYLSNVTTRTVPGLSVLSFFPGNLAAELYQDSTCSLFLQLYKTQPFKMLNPPFCLVSSNLNIESADIEILPAQSSQSCVNEAIVSFSANNLIFALTYCDFANGTRVSSTPKQIDVGTGTTLTTAQTGNGLLIVELHENGFCFNSHAHNIQSNTKMCLQTPQSTQNVLSYSYGMWQDWIDLIRNNESSLITPCNSKILHGAYDLGSSPGFDLYRDPTKPGTIWIIETHNGFTSKDIDVGQCGRPTVFAPNGGIVLDMWTIPQL